MIHPAAIVHPGAVIGDRVEIGPYAVIGEHVKIGNGTRIGPSCVIDGWTDIGENNQIFHLCSVGAVPQDLKYKGEETRLHIGNGNIIREFATLHLGTVTGDGETTVGDNNLFMAYSHVAHDCHIGNHVIMANGSTLAGHITVESYAILGGLSAVHQFARIGESAMIAGGSMVGQNVPPYTMASGDRATLHGLNLVGLKRRGFPEDVIADLKKAYKILIRSGLRTEEALVRIRQEIRQSEQVQHLVAFVEKSERGICR